MGSVPLLVLLDKDNSDYIGFDERERIRKRFHEFNNKVLGPYRQGRFPEQLTCSFARRKYDAFESTLQRHPVYREEVVVVFDSATGRELDIKEQQVEEGLADDMRTILYHQDPEWPETYAYAFTMLPIDVDELTRLIEYLVTTGHVKADLQNVFERESVCYLDLSQTLGQPTPGNQVKESRLSRFREWATRLGESIVEIEVTLTGFRLRRRTTKGN